MGRFPLQVCTVVLSLIPIATGAVTMLGVEDPLYRPLGLPSALAAIDANLPVAESKLARISDWKLTGHG